MNKIENANAQNALFIICPFCQLEKYLRNKYGEELYFLTSTAAVFNFNDDEVSAIKDFLIRENVKDIYLVNDVSCNFIEEAITNKKEFGLHCEKELRMLVQNSISLIESQGSLEAKKEFLAENNVLKQLEYLKTEKIFKQEIEDLGIKIHGIITDKHRSNNSIIQTKQQ
ncbi:MAG: hypothetical protein M3Q56_10915 [Bacteroidota bacterium]|nr:hypothetical protein [Bacteroidota bacterium]